MPSGCRRHPRLVLDIIFPIRIFIAVEVLLLWLHSGHEVDLHWIELTGHRSVLVEVFGRLEVVDCPAQGRIELFRHLLEAIEVVLLFHVVLIKEISEWIIRRNLEDFDSLKHLVQETVPFIRCVRPSVVADKFSRTSR